MSNNEENKVKFGEKFSLTMRKKWLVNGTKTALLTAILFVLFIALTLWLNTIDLPQFDVTENKIYTLSDASKDAVKNLNQDITIYVYGFDEKTMLIDLLKQYTKANDKIKYEIINEENNMEMVKEHELEEGRYVVILKSGDSEKIINAASDFYSYDYTTYQQIDITEQVLTNSILALTEEHKPNVYFTQGHGEFGADQIKVVSGYLNNESFKTNYINLATVGQVPEDCDILAILSPNADFLEGEAQMVKDYIHKGGKIYFSMDVVSKKVNLQNVQSFLDEYGVSIKNGYILEFKEGTTYSQAPYIFMPQVSSSHKITSDIYSDSFMWLVYAGKLDYKDDETLKNLNVTKETLLSSSDESTFIDDISVELNDDIIKNAEQGESDIAAILTKKITTTNENGETENKEAELIISATGSFASDYVVSALSTNYPLSYLGSNKDFIINAFSYLGGKENILTIRKDMSNSTYTPTEQQNIIVLTIIFSVPLIIIASGIVIGWYRKRRK